MIGVFIPSISRSKLVTTVKWLPSKVRAYTHLVVPRSQQDEYLVEGIGIQVLACDVHGIGPVRDWIMAKGRKMGFDKIIMMDDDLSFHVRRTDDPTLFRQAGDQDMKRLFLDLREISRNFAHFSILPKQGSNRVHDKKMFVENTRLLRVLGYDVKTFFQHKLTFTRLRFMEDFDVTLQLLRLGYANATLINYAQDQKGSQTEGGCSTYRTLDGQAAAAKGLKKLHPEFVEVVEKTTKGAWGGGTRTDVKIAWKKAFNSFHGSKA